MDKQATLLSEVSQDQYFYLVDGRVIKSLKELLWHLKGMDNNTFSHHVNKEKNDFSSWILHVMKDKDLAEKIKNSSKMDMIKIITERVNNIGEKPETSTTQPTQSPKKTITRKIPTKKETIQVKKALSQPNIPHPFKKGEVISITQEKIEEILLKELEIQKREEKILEIEDHLEKKLDNLTKIEAKERTKFFSGEFIQGVSVGLLVSLIAFLIYIKFF